jgi:hypothetical protein
MLKKTTPGGTYHGFYGRFRVNAAAPVHLLVTASENNGIPYLVFALDNDAPTFEYRLTPEWVQRVSGGWWMTHRGQIGLGGGGSISADRLLATVQRHAPELCTADFIDFGGIVRSPSSQVRALAGFVWRVYRFIELRNALREAQLAGLPDP